MSRPTCCIGVPMRCVRNELPEVGDNGKLYLCDLFRCDACGSFATAGHGRHWLASETIHGPCALVTLPLARAALSETTDG